MKKLITILLSILMLFSLTGCCLRHEPGPEVTCTEPQVCLKCGKVLEEATGHESGPEATCTEPQVCLKCGKVLHPALGHSMGAPATCTQPQTCLFCGEELAQPLGHNVSGKDGICTVCGVQVVEPGVNYHRPGACGTKGDSAEGLTPETQIGGHYHNDSAAYYSGTVLICGDYGLEYFNLDPTGSSNYAAMVNQFAARYPQLNVTSLLVPKCVAYECPEDYPDPHDGIADFISSTYDMMDSRVRTADAMSIMDEHAGEYMFYRTDHHWTSLGAYYAFVAYCQANDMEPFALEDYDTVVRTDVTGSLYMYSDNNSSLRRNPDYTVCRFPRTGYGMKYLANGTTWYNGMAVNAENRDYASVFMSGDQALTVITTDNHNGKNLIVFKESYGNAFVPYLIDQYEKIVVVDIRYDTDTTAKLVEEYGITDALVINNVQAAASLQSYLSGKLLT